MLRVAGWIAIAGCSMASVGCKTSDGKVTPTRDDPTARATAPSPAPEPTSPVSCDSLEARFRGAARALEKRCKRDAECDLFWSSYYCYAPHGPADDLAPLEAIEAAAKQAGCSEVECEPPPRQACRANLCTWDL